MSLHAKSVADAAGSQRALRISDDFAWPVRLRVVARFRRAVLTRGGPGLTTILPVGRDAGPQTCVVDDISSLPEVITLHRGDDATIRLDSMTGIVRTTLSLIRPPDGAAAVRAVRRLLCSPLSDSSGTYLAARARPSDPIAERIRALDEWLRYEPDRTVPPMFSGYGPGLTPSTDDFLVGAHGWFTALGHPDALKIAKLMSVSIAKAAPVSAEMFRSALVERYPEVMIHFLEFPSIANAKQFANHGATSGHDMAFGIFWAASRTMRDAQPSTANGD